MKPIRPFPFRASSPSLSSGWLLGGLLASLVLTTGCKRDEGAPTPSTKAPAGEPSATQQAATAAKKPPAAQGPLGNPTAVGPPLEILPGRGIGPIRFGATFETVERHMANPCDVRTETKCIYVNQAAEFTMHEGVVTHIQLHRRDRPAGEGPDGKPRYFGSYFGGLRPEIVMGVHRHIAVEELRPAERVEKLPGSDANATIERHHYPGLVVEYDRLPNGNVVVGGFQVLQDPDAPSPALSPEELAAKRAGKGPAQKGPAQKGPNGAPDPR